MSRIADSIRRGLQDAAAYVEGKADQSQYRIHVPEPIEAPEAVQKAPQGS